MDQNTADKIEYWQKQHREAGLMLCWWFKTCGETGHWYDYYSGDDWSYVKAWQERQAYCYRHIVRHRGF
jgi:hypothetical protein